MTSTNDPSQQFLCKMKSLYQRKMSNTIIMDEKEYQTKLSRLIELNNPLSKPAQGDFRLLKSYEIQMVEQNGATVTKLCKRGTKTPFLPIEDLYNAIHIAHIQLGHGGRNSLQTYLRQRYCNITKDCIMEYLQTCKDCPRRRHGSGSRDSRDSHQMEFHDEDDCTTGECSSPSDSGVLTNNSSGAESNNMIYRELTKPPKIVENANIITTAPMQLPYVRLKRDREKSRDNRFTRGQVDIFDMQNEPDGEFKFILRYTNLSTQEIRLRPIRSGVANEAANVLIDIYCDIGAPVVLQSLNGHVFAEELVVEIARIWPTCKQVCSSFTPNRSSNDTLIDKLSQLKKQNNTAHWAGLLRYLQWELNTTRILDLGCAPIERTFGRVPQLGLPPSKLIDAIYDKAHSEGSILEYLQDAELLRLSAFCQQSGVGASQSLHLSEKRSRPSLASMNLRAVEVVNQNSIVSNRELIPNQNNQICSINAQQHINIPTHNNIPTTGTDALNTILSAESGNAHNQQDIVATLNGQNMLGIGEQVQEMQQVQTEYSQQQGFEISPPIQKHSNAGFEVTPQQVQMQLPPQTQQFLEYNISQANQVQGPPANNIMMNRVEASVEQQLNYIHQQQQQHSQNAMNVNVSGVLTHQPHYGNISFMQQQQQIVAGQVEQQIVSSQQLNAMVGDAGSAVQNLGGIERRGSISSGTGPGDLERMNVAEQQNGANIQMYG